MRHNPEAENRRFMTRTRHLHGFTWNEKTVTLLTHKKMETSPLLIWKNSYKLDMFFFFFHVNKICVLCF